jgi:hypothetical protein
MEVFIIIFVAFVILFAAAIVIRYALKQKKQTDRLLRENEYSMKQQESAILAKALVVHSDGSALPIPSSKIPMALTLEVTPPDGKTYRARTQWMVDISAPGYLAQGQEVSVKIDRDDASKIYPNASWAEYSL